MVSSALLSLLVWIIVLQLMLFQTSWTMVMLIPSIAQIQIDASNGLWIDKFYVYFSGCLWEDGPVWNTTNLMIDSCAKGAMHQQSFYVAQNVMTIVTDNIELDRHSCSVRVNVVSVNSLPTLTIVLQSINSSESMVTNSQTREFYNVPNGRYQLGILSNSTKTLNVTIEIACPSPIQCQTHLPVKTASYWITPTSSCQDEILRVVSQSHVSAIVLTLLGVAIGLIVANMVVYKIFAKYRLFPVLLERGGGDL